MLHTLVECPLTITTVRVDSILAKVLTQNSFQRQVFGTSLEYPCPVIDSDIGFSFEMPLIITHAKCNIARELK